MHVPPKRKERRHEWRVVESQLLWPYQLSSQNTELPSTRRGQMVNWRLEFTTQRDDNLYFIFISIDQITLVLVQPSGPRGMIGVKSTHRDTNLKPLKSVVADESHIRNLTWTSHVVVTALEDFNDAQRQVTRDATCLEAFHVTNEPIAATLASDLGREEFQRVVDAGGVFQVGSPWCLSLCCTVWRCDLILFKEGD